MTYPFRTSLDEPSNHLYIVYDDEETYNAIHGFLWVTFRLMPDSLPYPVITRRMAADGKVYAILQWEPV